MRKSGSDPKVKKTLLRNYEQRILKLPKTIHDSDSGPSKLEKPSHQIEQDLDQPALCSSEALANYLTDVRKSASLPRPEELNIDQVQISAKITKKLNFHFNDRIYKNLVELNTDIANLKSRRDKKPIKNITPMKKDLEPNIDDFCQDEKENDVCPEIPVIKRKIKPIRRSEDGAIHRLIASLEKL
ncbi:uncharacterized protein LOC125069988 [Vanessa atalanta]|uniref:uncharacterized protein LOC125069988 n=1 Tax=Vanessa atalanta TaxID=42275 RepID=UPI001FCD71E8|nr:uncharacterized protein LOC125069988 [Vanessa atalanta]